MDNGAWEIQPALTSPSVNIDNTEHEGEYLGQSY